MDQESNNVLAVGTKKAGDECPKVFTVVEPGIAIARHGAVTCAVACTITITSIVAAIVDVSRAIRIPKVYISQEQKV